MSDDESDVDDDYVENLRDAIDLIACATPSAFVRAVGHLPERLQEQAYQAKEKLAAVACAVPVRRVRHEHAESRAALPPARPHS